MRAFFLCSLCPGITFYKSSWLQQEAPTCSWFHTITRWGWWWCSFPKFVRTNLPWLTPCVECVALSGSCSSSNAPTEGVGRPPEAPSWGLERLQTHCSEAAFPTRPRFLSLCACKKGKKKVGELVMVNISCVITRCHSPTFIPPKG